MVKRVNVLHRRVWLSTLLLPLILSLPIAGRAQSPGDVIQIGNSPYEWSQYNDYWNQLLNLGKPPAAPEATVSGDNPGAAVDGAAPTDQAKVDPAVLAKQLARNLRISNLRLQRVIKLNGSSQLSGSITNRNSKPVTVNSVNVEVIGPDGSLSQTIAAAPEPTTIPAGATVTFQRYLPTVAVDGGYRVRLSKTPFDIQAGP
jgi:hypothetical protein